MFETIGANTAFFIDIAALAASAAGLGVSAPLLPGDQVSGLQVFVRAGPTIDVSGADPTIEVYACNQEPQDVAAARRGTPVLPRMTLVCEPHEFLNDASQSVHWTLYGQLPFNYTAETHGLYLAVVITASDEAGVKANFLARVFRPERRRPVA